MSSFTIPSLSEQVPQSNSPFAKWFGSKILTFLGWRITGQFPERAKFVVAIAPHTSNWDFIVAVAAMLALQIKIKFLAKDALFFWPFSVWLKHIGGIPVERSKSHGVVGQMVSLFKHSEQLVLAIAPEGTRKKTQHWRSGFLQIAQQAQVPVVPLSLDFDKKEIQVHTAISVEDNIENELAKFQLLFKDVVAKNPENV